VLDPVDAQREHAQVIGAVHAADHQHHQVQAGQVGCEQVGQGVLGHRHELARHRRLLVDLAPASPTGSSVTG
jgi:hypothetical protein